MRFQTDAGGKACWHLGAIGGNMAYLAQGQPHTQAGSQYNTGYK
jgi:hypothetical protein